MKMNSTESDVIGDRSPSSPSETLQTRRTFLSNMTIATGALVAGVGLLAGCNTESHYDLRNNSEEAKKRVKRLEAVEIDNAIKATFGLRNATMIDLRYEEDPRNDDKFVRIEFCDEHGKIPYHINVDTESRKAGYNTTGDGVFVILSPEQMDVIKAIVSEAKQRIKLSDDKIAAFRALVEELIKEKSLGVK